MEHHSTQEYVGRNAAFLVILGGLLGTLGFISALSPLAEGLPVKLVLAIMLISRGSMQLYYGVKVRHWGHRIGAYMGLGSIVMSFVSVGCAVLVYASAWWESDFIMRVLACYLVVIGAAELLHSLELKSADGWFIIFWNGLASIAFGVMVWRQWPLAGAWAIGGIMGLSMMFGGFSLALLGATGRSYLIRQKEQGLVAQLE
jgi:uncharacterized membrane protein HdeD (DUF308 family)